MATVRITPTHLNRRVAPVPLNEQIGYLIDGMFELANGTDCIGLAANQVGFDKRIFVINISGLRLAFINPVIDKLWGGKQKREERIAGFDQNWKVIERNFTGWPATVIQHEYDHLDGITMYDRVKMNSGKL